MSSVFFGFRRANRFISPSSVEVGRARDQANTGHRGFHKSCSRPLVLGDAPGSRANTQSRKRLNPEKGEKELLKHRPFEEQGAGATIEKEETFSIVEKKRKTRDKKESCMFYFSRGGAERRRCPGSAPLRF